MAWNPRAFGAGQNGDGSERFEGGYECECGWLCDGPTADELGLVQPGAVIRQPADVAIRLNHALDMAHEDLRISDWCLQQLRLYHQAGHDHTSVQIAASDYWVADQLGLHRSQVRRNRARLEDLNYVKRIRPQDVTMYALQAWMVERRAEKKRLPLLLELRAGPDELPRCRGCGEVFEDAGNSQRLYHDEACRSRARREATAKAT
jgi:hypothetical protein